GLVTQLLEEPHEPAPRGRVDRVRQTRVLAHVEQKLLAPRVIALGHEALVQDGAAEQHPREVRRDDGTDDELAPTEPLAENANLGEPARAEHGARAADDGP